MERVVSKCIVVLAVMPCIPGYNISEAHVCYVKTMQILQTS